MAISQSVENYITIHASRMQDTWESIAAEVVNSGLDWYYLASMYRAGTAGKSNGYSTYLLCAAAREISVHNEELRNWYAAMLDA